MNTKVWAYAINGNFSDAEINSIINAGKQFVQGWTAHEQKLEASFEIFKGKIILVSVNEDVHNASGCSLDKLSRFMKELGAKYNFDPLNRLLVALKKGDGVDIVHSSKIKDLLQTGEINENTVVYNTAISSHDEYMQWEQTLNNTWLKKYLTPAL